MSEEIDITDSEDLGITMVDVLQEEEELENDAQAVLGAGDDTVCTYVQGYMKRQPLYACLSCCPVANGTFGGICLGCSYHCHEGHELLELYTKRFFRCDCGNDKFPSSNPCKLMQSKVTNNKNVYNANFEGKYCICARPYPDPDDKVQDSMIQCILCEDWYHGRHLKVVLPDDDDYSEMICYQCVIKLPFLKSYIEYTVNAESKEEIKKDESSPKLMQSAEKEIGLDCEKEYQISKNTALDSMKISGTSSNNDEYACKLNICHDSEPLTETLFFVNNWRKELCSCSNCTKMYQNLEVSFLIDQEDTVCFYESKGQAKCHAPMGLQRELDALSSLDRITRTEVVHEYNNLSSSLRDYLKKFAENGKVVRDDDIKEFFFQLSAKKKQKHGMQYFCK